MGVLALAIAMSGCNKAQDGAVLAKVNRNAITASDFKKQIEELAPQMQQAVVNDPKARREFLEDLIGIELVIQEAKRQGLDKDAEYKKRQEQLKKELERRVQDEAKNDLFNSLLKKELGDKMSQGDAADGQGSAGLLHRRTRTKSTRLPANSSASKRLPRSSR